MSPPPPTPTSVNHQGNGRPAAVQLSLFEPRRKRRLARAETLPAHQSGSETSRAAASLAAGKQRGRRAEFLAYIAARGPHGATRFELAEHFGLGIQSTCPVVHRMLTLGQVKRATFSRPTPSGHPAEVLIAAEGGETP